MGLNSESVIKIVDLLCEGPIEGIEGDRKGIFLDESPLQSKTGQNFVRKSHCSYALRQGGRIRAVAFPVQPLVNSHTPFLALQTLLVLAQQCLLSTASF